MQHEKHNTHITCLYNTKSTTQKVQHKKYNTIKPKSSNKSEMISKSGGEKVKDRQYKYNTNQYDMHTT